MDDEGSLLPTGERGEIVVRGSLVMAGYYKDPAAGEASRNGWHHQDCAVVGLPDDLWGARLTAVVQPRPGHRLDPPR